MNNEFIIKLNLAESYENIFNPLFIFYCKEMFLFIYVQVDPVLSTLYILFWYLFFEVFLKFWFWVLFLALVDLTSVRGFAFNFDLILVFETTCFVYIFFSVASFTFNKLTFIFEVGVTCMHYTIMLYSLVLDNASPVNTLHW